MKHALMLAASVATAAPLAAQATTWISRGWNGPSNGSSEAPALSADGRFVVFSSFASNLTPGDANLQRDIFRHDRATGTALIVNRTAGGAQANGNSGSPSVSSDGRFVAYASQATNLAPNASSIFASVYWVDVLTGATTRCSVPLGGAPTTANSTSPAVSPTGDRVAFVSDAADLVLGDTNGTRDVFLCDVASGATARVSLAQGGGECDAASNTPKISGDGAKLIFESLATNVVAGDTNGASDVFVVTFATGTTERVSLASNGAQANDSSIQPSISEDGRFVAFESAATNLVAGDTNGKSDAFVRDTLLGATERVSVDSNGVEAINDSGGASLSADGRFVLFASRAPNLVLGDTNQRFDFFLRDRFTGVTTRESVATDGSQGFGLALSSALSANGEIAAFETGSSFDPADTSWYDVYARDRFLRPTTYCTAGTSSNGCVPAIASSGSPSASASAGFVVRVTALEPQKLGLVFYGVSGASSSAWGAGSSVLCVKSPTQRTLAQNTGGTAFACDGALGVDLLAYWSANPNALGQPLALGQRCFAQAWYRDPAAPKTTNLSDALAFDLVP